MPSPRPAKVASLIRSTVATMLPQHLHEEKFGLLTVTDVALTKGLEQATIFVSCLKNKHQFDEEIGKHIFAMQKELNDQLVMRRAPKLVFKLDDTVGMVEKLEELGA